MVFMRDLLVAAYLLCTGYAQGQDCSSDIEINSQADADGIQSCGNYSGAITITAGGDITFNTLQSIGSLTANNASVSSISAPQLSTIEKEFNLQQLTYLSTLSMPVLNEVGSINFQTLPNLKELQFNAGVQKAQEVIISDTYLQSLSGLNLSDIATFNINNNKNIQSINVSISSVSNALDISFNSQSVNVSLPALQWANNATFRSCGSVDAPKLQSVNHSLGFFSNSFQSLSFDGLETIGDLTINQNNNLANMSFNSIKELDGALVVANNSKLGSITGFSNVQTVRGALTLIGNFTQASMPALNRVEGDVDVESEKSFECSDFDSAHENGDFYGDKYVCKGASTTVSANINTATQTGGHSDSGSSGSGSSGSATGGSSSSSNAAAGADFNIAGLAVALFSLL